MTCWGAPQGKSEVMSERRSPWSHDGIAPLQSAGALVPLTRSSEGILASHEQGTAFFITASGLFLTAAHTIPDDDDVALFLAIFGSPGMLRIPVEWVAIHPVLDVALGFAPVHEQQVPQPRPLTLSTVSLSENDHVAVLGYPQTKTVNEVRDDGQIWSRLTLTPDFYEGEVEEHHPEGLGFVRGAAYRTNHAPPKGSKLKNLGGLSGGPLLSCRTLHVHGLLSRSSDGENPYALCTDIRAVFDWEHFVQETDGSLVVVAEGRRYSGIMVSNEAR